MYSLSYSGDNLSLFMEWMPDGDLGHYVPMSGRPPPPARPLVQRISWVASIAEAIAYIHQRGHFHRDIKLENVLVRLQEGLWNYAAFLLSPLPAEFTIPGALTYCRCFALCIPRLQMITVDGNLQPRLADFGLCKPLNMVLQTPSGTPGYIAPEIGSKAQPQTIAVDTYSYESSFVLVCLYFLFSNLSLLQVWCISLGALLQQAYF